MMPHALMQPHTSAEAGWSFTSLASTISTPNLIPTHQATGRFTTSPQSILNKLRPETAAAFLDLVYIRVPLCMSEIQLQRQAFMSAR